MLMCSNDTVYPWTNPGQTSVLRSSDFDAQCSKSQTRLIIKAASFSFRPSFADLPAEILFTLLIHFKFQKPIQLSLFLFFACVCILHVKRTILIFLGELDEKVCVGMELEPEAIICLA